MNIPSNFIIAPAQPQDGEEVNRVFKSQSFEGGIAVSFLREPDPISSFLREGDELVMMTLRDTRRGKEQGQIIGIGCCVIRLGILHGRPCRFGYLTGLKLLPQYRGQILLIPAIYQELRRLTADKTDLYYTTILSENTEAQKMLEKKRRIMPEYCYRGEYHTYFIRTGAGFFRNRSRKKDYIVEPCTKEEAQFFYRSKSMKANFSWAEALQNDLTRAAFYGLYERLGRGGKGQLLAVGYTLDQRDYKQYVVHHYSGPYRMISKLPMGISGYPDFPKPGETAPCAAAGLFCSTEEGALEQAGFLWQEMRRLSTEYGFLIIGVHERDPLIAAFQKEKKIDYKSRFYQVIFHDGQPQPSVTPEDIIHLDAAFL